MRVSRLLPAVLVLVALSCSPVFADATLFIGSTLTPSHRTAKGFSIGAGLLIVGVEFEYASTVEDSVKGAPSLRTSMGNFLLQTPVPLAGMQFYWTTGAGGYRERLGDTRQETNIAFNTGGGAKISLIGPLKVRLDYRVIKLRGNPLSSTLHRVYAGVNLGF